MCAFQEITGFPDLSRESIPGSIRLRTLRAPTCVLRPRTLCGATVASASGMGGWHGYEMSRPLQIVAMALLIASLAPSCLAQSGQSRYDPAPPQRTSKGQDSFLDFTLKRINPTDIDYGQCLAEHRTILFEETIRNSYFWSNIFALSL